MSKTNTTTDEPTKHRIPITAVWAHVRTDHGDLQLPALERESTCDAAVEAEIVDFDSSGESILDGEKVIRLTITQKYGGLSSLLMLEYKCEREGTHSVAVDPKNTTKECASCGVKTDKS